MDTTLLRTLTWKSTLGFGKYKDLKIQEIVKVGHTQYLRWVYYCMEGISFIDDILIEIGIIDHQYDNRIEKPGTNHELHEKLLGIKFNNSCKKIGAARAVNNCKSAKMFHMRTLKRQEKITFSKGNLQRMNQGHHYKNL